MKFYLYSSMVMCVVDFIKNCRLMKYRKHVDNRIEMIRTTMNIFLPLYNLLMLIDNLNIIFRSKEHCELIAMLDDMAMLDREEQEGPNE